MLQSWPVSKICLQLLRFLEILGTGKSFNANILIYQMVLYGGYGLIIDPKGEQSHWEKQLIVLRGLISTVTLGQQPVTEEN